MVHWVEAESSKYISVFVSQWSGAGSQGYERDLLADNQTLIQDSLPPSRVDGRVYIEITDYLTDDRGRMTNNSDSCNFKDS